MNKIATKITRRIKQSKVLLLALCVLFVFKETFMRWIIDYICPLTENVANDSVWVQSVIFIAIVIIYGSFIKQLLQERELWLSRYYTLILIVVGYFLFRLCNNFNFYGIEGWRYNYIDYAWWTILVVEFGLFIYRFVKYERRMNNVDTLPFFADTPACNDELNRERYAKQLVEKIISTSNNKQKDADKAYTILLNEHYGVGKTSFMLQLQQIAKKSGISVCWYKPWMYEDTQTMMVNLIRVIQESLGEGDDVLQNMLNRYVRILSSLNGYEWFSFINFDKQSVESQYEEIKEELNDKECQIVVLIDDVDRLQGKELLQVLQLIRNMGDFPNLYYVIAGDKKTLQSRLEEENIKNADEFLKKFFNLEICFPADDEKKLNILRDSIEVVLKHYDKKSDEIWFFIQNLHYKNEIFSNLREIKRFLNIFDYTMAIFRASKDEMLNEIRIRDLVGLCIIQCVDSDFYKLLRDHNEYVLEYKDWQLKLKKDFLDVFTDRATKKMVNDVATSIVNKDEEPKNPIKEEIDQSVKTLSDVIEWSQPQKIEIVGEVLNVLFPQSHTSESKVGICYPSEYFKYFSASYRGTEISNAEIIGIMKMDVSAYQDEMNKVLGDGRMEAFKHKLTWYLQTQQYDRIPALEKVMKAFQMEWQRNRLSDSYKDIVFLQNYGASLLAIFVTRKEETIEQKHGVWELLRQWLIISSDYESRILVLRMIAMHVENHSAYIFETREKVMDCVEESQKRFIDYVWSKNMYSPEIYHFIPSFSEISPKISEYVIEYVFENNKGEDLLLHLVTYENGDLQWNKDFIDSVLGSHLVFSYDTSLWLKFVPQKWSQECRRWNMHSNITQEDIEQSAFLKYALRYWKRRLELSPKEEQRLMQISQIREMTVSQYKEFFGVSEQLARMDLSKFEKLGYMQKLGTGSSAIYIKK